MKPGLRAGALFLLAGCALLMVWMPVAIRSGCWTHSILRNWEGHGLLALGGRPVYNPGGHGVTDAPQVYSGHSARGLWVPYALRLATGGRLHESIPFGMIMGLVTGAAAFALLRGRPWAGAAACAAAFSAGSLRMAGFYDPILQPLVFGLPLFTLARSALDRDRLTAPALLGLGALLLPVLAINWTSAFLLAALLPHLLVALPGRRGRWLAFSAVATAVVGAVTLAAFQAKGAGGGAAGHAFDTYLFGARGYDGRGMTWSRAVIRIGAACALCLLPLWLLLPAALRRHPPRVWLPALLPLASTAGMVLVMRNYFAHHPWMATPVILTGLLSSLSLPGLLRSARPAETAAQPATFGARTVAAALAVLAWNAGLILMFQVNVAAQSSLMTLVDRHTARADVLEVSAATDPWLATNHKVLSELFDRRVVTAEDAVPQRAPAAYRLTAHPAPGTTPVAWQSEGNDGDAGIASRLVTFYRERVARRPAGDRLDIRGPYALVPLPPR